MYFYTIFCFDFICGNIVKTIITSTPCQTVLFFFIQWDNNREWKIFDGYFTKTNFQSATKLQKYIL